MTGTSGGDRACSYYGKLPARADFLLHGLGHDTVERWDAWLQQALAASQAAAGEGWRAMFFEAPLWRFMLPPGACGRTALIGVMMPSVDAVGRCFPLMLGQELAALADPVALMAGSTRWFDAAEELAIATLRDDATPAILERPLPSPMLRSWPAAGAAQAGTAGPPAWQGVGRWSALPLLATGPTLLSGLLRPGRGPLPGVWWSAGARRVPPGLAITGGLVPSAGFPALLDGQWARHGWSVGGPERGPALGEAAGAADWDRDA